MRAFFLTFVVFAICGVLAPFCEPPANHPLSVWRYKPSASTRKAHPDTDPNRGRFPDHGKPYFCAGTPACKAASAYSQQNHRQHNGQQATKHHPANFLAPDLFLHPRQVCLLPTSCKAITASISHTSVHVRSMRTPSLPQRVKPFADPL